MKIFAYILCDQSGNTESNPIQVQSRDSLPTSEKRPQQQSTHTEFFFVGVELRLKVMALLATTNHFSASSGFFSELHYTPPNYLLKCAEMQKRSKFFCMLAACIKLLFTRLNRLFATME